MNKLFLILNIFSFLYFSKEKIIYYRDYGTCDSSNNIIGEIIEPSNEYYLDYYGFSAENCRLKKPKFSVDEICCFVELLFNNKWYYFCSEVKIEDYKNSTNFTESFIENIDQNYLKNINIKKDLIVDCFSIKIKRFSFLLYFFYLIILLNI